MCIGLDVEYALLLSRVNKTCIFSTCFRKILKYQISPISVLWGSSSKGTEGQVANLAKLIVSCGILWTRPKTNICYFYLNMNFVPQAADIVQGVRHSIIELQQW